MSPVLVRLRKKLEYVSHIIVIQVYTVTGKIRGFLHIVTSVVALEKVCK